MIVRKEDIIKALSKLGAFKYNLDKIQKIADANNLAIEELTIGDKPYSEFIKEGFKYCDELDVLLEAARESVIEELDERTIALLNSLDRIEGDTIQDYYMSEKYNNLPFIVERAKKIKPLYTRKRIAAFIKRKYREAILCFFDGRFDSCCAMCRSIAEIVLKELCKNKFGGKANYEAESLSSLINICAKYKILEGPRLNSAIRIKKTGNESMHSKISKNEQDALTSIEDIQKILKDF